MARRSLLHKVPSRYTRNFSASALKGPFVSEKVKSKIKKKKSYWQIIKRMYLICSRSES